MCNAFNGIAIVLCFRGISIVTGFSEAIWQVIITLAIIISTWYSANYFAALLLIVIIALLFIALTPLVKKLLSHLHDRS